ncbi:MAG: sugar phosphate isomerase/epimerase [Clostridia bacterium]|nr:sugar phosphate isomerase/epimerase [Clostridia bacterium]
MRANIRYGCVVMPEDYALAAQAGFDYVELSGRAVCAMEPAAFDTLRREVAGGPLPCYGFNAYCPPEVRIAGPGFSPEAARDYALRSAERAAALDVRKVGIGSPLSRNLPPDYDPLAAWDQAVVFFDLTARVFSEIGVTVCVEALGPCYCNFINYLAEAQRLIHLVDLSNLRLVLDFYNMEHAGEADIPLEPFAGDIAHAHISDDAGDPYKRWFLRPEKRPIHLARLRRLYRAGYAGAVTAEIDLRMNLGEAEQTLALFRASNQ